MQTHQYLSQHSRKGINYQQGQTLETVTPNPPSDDFSAGEDPIFVEGILLVGSSFFLAALWLLVLLARLDWLKAIESRTKPVKHYRQSPCLSCKFFKNDPYLKCAVNPTLVLSEEAQNCSDYSPLERRRRIFR
jgi:hypothetical protein